MEERAFRPAFQASASASSNIWKGFQAVSGTPRQILLKVTSAASCVSSSNDGEYIDYSLDGGSTFVGAFYILGLFAGVNPVTRPLQTDVISLPTNTNSEPY